jgi:hypothetical protein
VRPRRLLPIAVLAYVVAWFVPVIEGGATLADGEVPGVEALLVAIGPLLSLELGDSAVLAVLSVISGATNLLFAAGVVLLLRRRDRPHPRLALALAAAALVNTMWILVGDPTELRVGYYLWFLSFPLLAWTTWKWEPA